MNITKQQIKSIYALGAGLGMIERDNHDDALHQLVDGLTGKASVRTLDSGEASRVIAELMQRMRGLPSAPPAPKRPKRYDEAPGGVTADQQRKVWALMYDLKKFDLHPVAAPLGERLCGIVRRQFSVDCTAKAPMRFLSTADGHHLIEILKKYCYNAEARHIREVGGG